MERHYPSRARWTLNTQRIVALAAIVAAILPDAAASAQARSARDTATAYGARLNARGEPANLNPNRINNRVSNRLETRLSLRVERYRPNSANDPAAAFAARPIDNTRVGIDTKLSSSSTSTSTSVSQAYGAMSQSPAGSTSDRATPR